MGKGSKPKQRVTRYYLSTHLGVCHGPVDAIYQIRLGDKLAWAGRVESNQTITINQPELYGGVKKEGGPIGDVDVMLGGASQLMSDGLASMLGVDKNSAPGFRGICSLFFGSDGEFAHIMNNPNLPLPEVAVEDTPTSLGTEFAKIPKGVARTEIVNLNSLVNVGASNAAGVAAGVTLTGFDPDDILLLTLPKGQTYTAWSLWGIPAYSGANTGSNNFFRVARDGDSNDVEIFGVSHPTNLAGQWNGYEAARAGFGSAFITGASSYTFFIFDNNSPDNSGGLSIQAQVNPLIHANPAHVIYDLLTQSWPLGAGMDASQVDVDSFTDAAETLFNEGLGISFVWTDEKAVNEIINEIIDHIDAVLYASPSTGLMTLKLIRQDYTVGSLRVVNPSNARLISFQRKTNLTNSINVTWTDPETEADASTPALQNEAAIKVNNGVVISDSRNYYMIRDLDLAVTLGWRALRAASYPLAAVELELDRSFWDVVPGEVLNLSWPERSITQLLVRVGAVDYGDQGNSLIKVTAIEDVFGLDDFEFTSPSGSLFVDQAEAPDLMAYQHAFTLPYYMVVNSIDSAVAASVADPEVFAGVLGAQTGEDTFVYNLLSEVTDGLGNTSYGLIGQQPVLARGELIAPLVQEVETTLASLPTLTTGTTPAVGSFALLGEAAEEDQELVIFSVVDPGGTGYTIQRGALDTTPKDWPAGTPIWILPDDVDWSDDTIRAATVASNWKLLSVTSEGVLDEADATVLSATLTDRPWLPTRPADVQIEATAFGVYDATGDTTSLTVDWANRNRLTEDSLVLAWDDADVTGEDSQTTTIEVLDTGGGLLTTHSGLTGTTYEVPLGSFSSEVAGIIKVSAALDGNLSLQGHEIGVVLDADVLTLGGEIVTIGGSTAKL